ncbi:MAG: DEAD/DEAH box helicase [Acidimicrobiia bacterium]|nr:DEAD/DEAH box helicase [Acidimicrobiia bacterium]
MDYIKPEDQARILIDGSLTACGWEIQDYRSAAVAAAPGVAVREARTEAGPADYVLFVDGQAVGVIEAKREGTTLTGAETQTSKYQTAYPENLPAFRVDGDLPFGYESTGTETRFTSLLDPVPTSRGVFAFHRPETLARWVNDYADGSGVSGIRGGLHLLPELEETGLWPAQARAIRNLEKSLQDNRPRALIQMATGSGKTFTAVNVSYRLLRHAGAQRVLFLVDRANLGRQTITEFEKFDTPDDGRKFTELYNARMLDSSDFHIDREAATKVHVSTIQRIYSVLRGEPIDQDLDEQTGFEIAPERPVEVTYNEKLPIEAYDLIIVDECHRSIYGVWRQVLEYFDAFLIGLTATPGKQTFGFFHQNLVMEYNHEQAVADRVNVDFDVFRIRTEVGEEGGTVPAGFVTEFRDRETRQTRLDQIDQDIDWDASDLDKKVVAPDQIRTVVRTLRDSMPEMFPDRVLREDGRLEHIPKTLIFAKTDSHADDIVQIVREEFGLDNLGAVKITYTARLSGHKPDDLLQRFRTSYETRIAVTVDMIATGTDVKPIECVVFMRMVRSRNFFEQMKGRGVRVMPTGDLLIVTPDAQAKERFVLVDAVGVTDTNLHDTVPLERKPGMGFDRLLNLIGLGDTSEDVISSAASRLARLDKRITQADREEVEEIAGMGLGEIASRMVDALNPDHHYEAAKEEAGSEEPNEGQIASARTEMIKAALESLTSNSMLRQKLIEVRRSYEQIIDTATRDRVISSEYSREATDHSRNLVDSFEQFIEENRDEINALEILYRRPYKARLTYADIKQLANAIKRPPRAWTPDVLWRAYEVLDESKVRGSGPRINTDLVSLVRYALGESEELVAYKELVEERFEAWLTGQANLGRSFDDGQLAYLHLIKDHLVANLSVEPKDLMEAPFSTHGGLGRASRLFGEELNPLLTELTEELAA